MESVAYTLQSTLAALALVAAIALGMACDPAAAPGPDAAPDARTGQARFTLVCHYSGMEPVHRCFPEYEDWGFECPDQSTQDELCGKTGAGGHSRACIEDCDVGQ